MSNLKRKLSSRKLWAAIVGVVTGLAMVFGLDEGTVSNVAGAVVSMSAIVSYIYSEGKVDAANSQNIPWSEITKVLMSGNSNLNVKSDQKEGN